MDSTNITRMPDGKDSRLPRINITEIKGEPSIHFPKVYNALAREGMEVAKKLLEAGLHVTLFGRPADFSSRWRKRWSRLSFVALGRDGSCGAQAISDGLKDPTDAIILVRDYEWEPHDRGWVDDLEFDAVAMYSINVYKRFIVVPHGEPAFAN